MEDRKLNFNAPLLSVRRHSSTFSSKDKQKIVENEISPSMTEPVAVPFVWEQIPGKAKSVSGFENEDDVYYDSFSINYSISGSTAKEMTLKTPPYASRKQSMARPEQVQPGEVRKVPVGGRVPLVNQYESIIIPHYEDSYNNLSRTACGLLPRLCFMSYICLFNPVPRLKFRIRSSISSTGEVAKPTGKATSIKSPDQIVDKYSMNNWDVACNNKSNRDVEPPRLLEDKSDTGVQSHLLTEFGKKLSCGSNQFASSNDMQMVNWLPPNRPPSSFRISPYRRERPQSPFTGGGFLGMPKEAEEFKPNMLVKYTISNNNCKELVPYMSNKQGSDSLNPAVEKPLYDEVEPATVESSLQVQDINGLNVLDRKGISENEITGSVNSSSSSFSDKPDLGEAKGGSDYPPLPPPLPKTPSESWLSRALPAVSSRNSFSKSYSGIYSSPKKQEPKLRATCTKWYLHHHHQVRHYERSKT